jgi:hypothetical protein
MWTGFRNGYQMVFGASVTIRRVNGYSQPILRSDFTIESPSAHILWPQFIAPDHFSGSNMLFDTPVVIRWAQAGGNTITEQATVYASGLFGRVFNLASWNVSDAFPGRTCPGVITQPGSCFAGDYRYGAFWEKTAAGALSYYTPWTGFSSASGMGSPTGASRMRAFGGMITVTP